MSIASSDTLSTASCQDADVGSIPGVPYELTETILGKALDSHIHEWVISPVDSHIFDNGRFLMFWRPVCNIMAVSSTFNAIVIRFVCIAFGIRPAEDKGLPFQVYYKLRSLFYFRRSIYAGAYMTPPPAWESPLMEAYGIYFIMQKQRSSTHEQMTTIPVLRQINDLPTFQIYCRVGFPAELGAHLLDECLKLSGAMVLGS